MFRTARNFLSVTLWALVLLSAPLTAIVPPEDVMERVADRGFSTPVLHVEPSLEIYSLADKAAAAKPGLDTFFARHSGDWEVRWDRRNDRPHLIQGRGIALIPGRGNELTARSLGVETLEEVGLQQVESAVRSFLAGNDVLRVGDFDLRLDEAASGVFGQSSHYWNIELQQHYEGVPVEGAKAFFRLSHGNLVQLGTERIAAVRIDTRPSISRGEAFKTALQALGVDTAVEELTDPGSLLIFPVMGDHEKAGELYKGIAGEGYGHRLAWRFTYFLEGDHQRYQVSVDAQTGEVLDYLNLTWYATVQGNVYPTTNTDPLVSVPFPSTSVTNGGVKVTDANGNYTYSGGTATAQLNGRYININDNCGPISLSNSTTGDLDFGGVPGTNCTTPGFGGAGNTNSARSGFYHLTNINRKAATFLPGNAWLNGTLTANMNIPQTCNAFWNGSTVNFYRSGGGCANTGEIAAVFLHEWGHGMDENAGGAPPENGSGEALADTFAFLETKTACIGDNFSLGTPCYNCDPSCSGVRDIAAFSLGGISTIARPNTVASNSGIDCDRFSCPYLIFGIFPYQGPMGYEGHCESYIASGATWDLSQRLVQDHGDTVGWATMDDIWYSTLNPSKSAYRVASGGKCNPSASVDGCAASNWYTVFLPADDDDGNLANGTPNACRIWDAFDAHGIACGSRPSCSGYYLAQPDPGLVQQVNTFTTYGGTPGQTTYFLYGFTPGSVAVPGCPGVHVGIQDINIFSNGPADAFGEYAVSTNIPNISGSTVLFQSVELSTCKVTNLVSYTWP